MKILVTGGAGFIGSHIVEHFKNEDVIVIDNLRSGFKENIKGLDTKFIKGSITDLSLLKKWMRGVKFVFHLGALISVPESILKPKLCEEINVLGTINVLEAAKEHRVEKVVLSSSAAVYGTNPTLPKIETMTPEPKSPYAITKLAGEYYLKMYMEEFGLQVCTLRYFNVFGERQNPKSQYAAAIPIFVYNAIQNKDIVIYGDGQQTRDFIYVKEVVDANVLAAEKGNDIYNTALGKKITILDLAKKIIQMTNSNSKILHEKERPGDIKHSYADITKIKNLGFNPGFDFDEGLKKTIEYFKTKINKRKK